MSTGEVVFSPNDLSALRGLRPPADPISRAQTRVKQEEEMSQGAGIRDPSGQDEDEGTADGRTRKESIFASDPADQVGKGEEKLSMEDVPEPRQDDTPALGGGEGEGMSLASIRKMSSMDVGAPPPPRPPADSSPGPPPLPPNKSRPLSNISEASSVPTTTTSLSSGAPPPPTAAAPPHSGARATERRASVPPLGRSAPSTPSQARG